MYTTNQDDVIQDFGPNTFVVVYNKYVDNAYTNVGNGPELSRQITADKVVVIMPKPENTS